MKWLYWVLVNQTVLVTAQQICKPCRYHLLQVISPISLKAGVAAMIFFLYWLPSNFQSLTWFWCHLLQVISPVLLKAGVATMISFVKIFFVLASHKLPIAHLILTMIPRYSGINLYSPWGVSGVSSVFLIATIQIIRLSSFVVELNKPDCLPERCCWLYGSDQIPTK